MSEPAAGEPAATVERKPARTRARREAAAPDGSALASGSPPSGRQAPPDASAARTSVMRQGLPRVGAYRASAVTRSAHPTPVATPIVTVAPTAPTPRATDDAVPKRNGNGSARPFAIPETVGAPITAVPSVPTAGAMIARGTGVDATNPVAAVANLVNAPLATAAAVPSTPTAGATSAHGTEPTSSAAAVADPRSTRLESASAPGALAAGTLAPTAEAVRTGSAEAATRPSRRRTLQIGLGGLGAAVLVGVILLSTLGSSRNEPRRDTQSVLPAAANLVQAVSDPHPAVEAAVEGAPRAVTPSAAAREAPPVVASPRAVAPSLAAASEAPPVAAAPAKPAMPTAGAEPPSAKPATPTAAASLPARAESAPVRPAPTGESPPAARPTATREPARPAKPASPPRAAPARAITYDPDALFLQKP